MGKPELNEKLLKCVLDYIKKHPKNYNQNTWAEVMGSAQTQEPYCGTTGCVAGWTCLLTLPEKVDWLNWAREKSPDGGGRNFQAIAQEKLGLTDYEAGYLFGGCDYQSPKAQYKEILKRVAAIKKGRKTGEDLEDIHETY